MSYTQEIKETLCAEMPQRLCCRKAIINGFLVAATVCCEQNTLHVKLGHEGIVSYFKRLVVDAYHQPITEEKLPGRGHQVKLSFYSKSASQFVSSVDRDPEYPIHQEYKCENCRCAFLTGVFLASGHISAPESGYRLDLSLLGRHAFIASFLTHNGIKPLISTRQGKTLLYYRSNEAISDFFGILKQVDVYFRIQNAYFTRDLNNVTNRQNNCTIGNIQRSIRTVSEQIRIITALEERHMLSQLPDELRETAELRLKYFDLSLSQLAMMTSPPLTKSGLNHRISKIISFAKENGID
jgi:DNA-binding protein WhiA